MCQGQGVVVLVGEGVGVGVQTPPHSCSPPLSRAPNPPGSQIKTSCRETACRWQCNAVPLPGRHPRPVSLLDSLPVAVSLAVRSGLAVAAAAAATTATATAATTTTTTTTTAATAAAAAGLAASAPVPGAAGLADLAGLAAVLQRGAGLGPLQPVVLQQLGLEHRQVLLAAPDLSSQQHDVRPVPGFL